MLNQLVQEVGEWAEYNFGNNTSKVTGQVFGSINPLLGIVEEVGELTHATLKYHQGIRGFDFETYVDKRDDAVADLVIFLANYAYNENIDLEKIVNKTWNKVKQRNWKNNPVSADKE